MPCCRVAARQAAGLGSVLLFIVGFAGCGSGEPAPPAAAQVTGKVTYNGAGPKNAQINFTNLKTGTGGSAPISDDGSYSISLFAQDYVVTVDTRPGESKAMPDITKLKPGETPPTIPEAAAPPPPTNAPAKYAVANTSGLKATLTKGPNTVNFELKD